MNGIKGHDSVRVAIVSALIALSVGLLAMLHDKERILGFFLVDGGFIAVIYNVFVLFLTCEIIFGVIFLLSTGYCLDFRNSNHSFSKKIQRISYEWVLGLFPVSCSSVLYNGLIRVIGLDSFVGIEIVAIVFALMLLVYVILMVWKKREGKKYTNGDSCKYGR